MRVKIGVAYATVHALWAGTSHQGPCAGRFARREGVDCTKRIRSVRAHDAFARTLCRTTNE